MILDDFVMLGTTVPEPVKDGRIFVCSAGVSVEARKLVRIYPLARRNIPKRWHRFRVPVEVNPEDSRPESYKVSGNRQAGAHERINDRFQLIDRVPEGDRAALLAPYTVGSIAEANQRNLSLAIIHPDNLDLYYEHNPDSLDSPQLALFDDHPKPTHGAKRFPYLPRLRFTDECGEHKLMLRDWGCYELMRKNGNRYDAAAMAQALHMSRETSLFVGNLNNRRTTWLVISVINHVRQQPSLFDALPGHPTVPPMMRRAVYERDHWMCVNDGKRDDLTVDLVIPARRGGQIVMGNLQTLCKRCNSKKSDHVPAGLL